MGVVGGSSGHEVVGISTMKVCFRRFPFVGRSNRTEKPTILERFPPDPAETAGSR